MLSIRYYWNATRFAPISWTVAKDINLSSYSEKFLAIKVVLAQLLHLVNCDAIGPNVTVFPIVKRRSKLLPAQVARAVNFLFVAFANKHAKSTPQVKYLFPFNGALATPKSLVMKALIV